MRPFRFAWWRVGVREEERERKKKKGDKGKRGLRRKEVGRVVQERTHAAAIATSSFFFFRLVGSPFPRFCPQFSGMGKSEIYESLDTNQDARLARTRRGRERAGNA